MNRRPLDPRKVNVTLDANVFDQEPELVARLCSLRDAQQITILVPGGVRSEAQHPRTPEAVQSILSGQIFSIDQLTELTEPERRKRERVRAVLQGNAAPGAHRADADHLFDADKHGAGHFITHDRRMVQTKRKEL